MSKSVKGSLVLLALLVLGCAEERPVKPVLGDGLRVAKADLQGTYLFHKMTTGADFASGSGTDALPGRYEIDNVLVQLNITEKTLEVVAIDPLFSDEKAALRNTVLAAFPIKNIDVLRKQNVDGDDTHEEEITETRRDWKEREYVVIEAAQDSQDALTAKVSVDKGSVIKVDREEGAINFSIKRQLKDDSQISQRYSFLKFNPNTTYEQREYPVDLQTRFGFFKTQTIKFDKYGRITQTNRKEYMNRFDTNKKIIYYLSKDYPKHLIAPTKHVFAQWNLAFKAATGKDVLEVRENSGQELGDLRYSMITFDNTQDAAHGVLGYGPSYSNPRTGEIVKADVILYGGILKTVVFRERIWDALLGAPAVPANNGAARVEADRLNALRALKASRAGKALDLKLINRLNTLAPQQLLDKELINSIRKEFAPEKMLKQLKAQARTSMAKNSTLFDEGVFKAVQDGMKDLTDEQIETLVFIPLLTHELGHNLGLRHNFMGSVDHTHFAPDAKSSSVMDYAYLTAHEGVEVGPYDKAAIAVGYGNDSSKTDALIADNYFFCTDEDTFSSQTAVCNQHDAGTSLSEIATNVINRYRAGFVFNNMRFDQVFFNQTTSAYVQRLLRSMLPIRNIYDHAATLLESIEQRDLNAIWLLARQRVEADTTSDAAAVQEIQVLAGFKTEGEGANIRQIPVNVTRRIDTNKIALVGLDAQLAKNVALGALRDIVIDNSQNRPNFDLVDQIRGERLIRGVLVDKMIALNIIGSRMSSPLNDGTVVTTFPKADDEPTMPVLFRQLLSNAVLANEPGFDPAAEDQMTFDINLRDFAIDVIKDELSGMTLAAPMRKLIATERIVLDRTDEPTKKLLELNQKMRGLLAKIYKGDLTEEQRAAVVLEINAVEEERGAIPFAQTEVIGNQVFKAPLELPEFNMISASGLFMLRSVNLYESIAGGMTDARELLIADIRAELAKPEAEQNQELLQKLSDDIREKSRTILLVNQIVELNRGFIEKMQLAFDPR